MGGFVGPQTSLGCFEKIKRSACAIIQSPDRPARNLITVTTPFVTTGTKEKATKNLA